MRTLVTGGAGFIGATLVDRLLAEGHEVEVVDDLSTGSAANLDEARASHGDRLSLAELDIRSAEVIDHVAASRPEVVFHLAAQAAVPVSVARPVFDAEVNVLGTLHVLEGARAAGARKVVYAASGGTLYGDPDPSDLPLDEDRPPAPTSPYGITKGVVIDYLRAYRALHGLEWTALALANVYGPRQDPHGEAGVMAIFARRLLAEEPCQLFDAGRNTRDYVYVEDVVDGFVRAAAKGEGLVCNIGTGVETSTRAVYEALVTAAGITDREPVLAPPRAGDLARSALDPTRAGDVLGWSPQVPLADGVIRTYDWFRQHR
ncbi:MAG: NAD-dependent epimerase/dehydratase family protein [Acidimicrobiia bacterium]|nr:NAD-dependent epimerase/dehydratase family protein [Acidimicrobiia bacterium]